MLLTQVFSGAFTIEAWPQAEIAIQMSAKPDPSNYSDII